MRSSAELFRFLHVVYSKIIKVFFSVGEDNIKVCVCIRQCDRDILVKLMIA